MLAQEKKRLTELLAKIPVDRQRKVVKREKRAVRTTAQVTENGVIELRIVGNAGLIQKLEYIAVELGADLVEELEVTTVPAERVEEEFAANSIGTILQGMRFREGLTQVELSKSTGIPQRHISEMENGKRTIGKLNARRLATVMDVDYRVFL